MKLKYAMLIGILLLSIFIVGCVDNNQLKCLDEKAKEICKESNASFYFGFQHSSFTSSAITEYEFECILSDRSISKMKHLYSDEIKICEETDKPIAFKPTIDNESNLEKYLNIPPKYIYLNFTDNKLTGDLMTLPENPAIYEISFYLEPNQGFDFVSEYRHFIYYNITRTYLKYSCIERIYLPFKKNISEGEYIDRITMCEKNITYSYATVGYDDAQFGFGNILNETLYLDVEIRR